MHGISTSVYWYWYWPAGSAPTGHLLVHVVEHAGAKSGPVKRVEAQHAAQTLQVLGIDELRDTVGFVKEIMYSSSSASQPVKMALQRSARGHWPG